MTMRWKVINYYIGVFLRIFSVLMLVPVAVGKFYGESFVLLEPFLIASFTAIVLGSVLARTGSKVRPEPLEAMATATLAWLLAVGLGAIPLHSMTGISFLDAYFEAMSGMTTTGMSMLLTLDLPKSLLFWRVFMQWIGGLGILTFFVTVLVESGGVARKLVATEANKTSGGSVRASLFTSIKTLWYVYVVLTVLEILALHHFGMTGFQSVVNSLSTLPTGGFASTSNLSALMNPGIKATMILFMFLGGTNFLLIYSVMKGNLMRMFKDFEFRLYSLFLISGFGLVAADLVVNSGATIASAFETSAFHSTSVLTSTGFVLEPLRNFPGISKFVFLVMMFVGGSLGSTTGGIKMLRLGIVLKVVRQQIRSLGIPRTVLNPVSVGGRILGDDEIRQVVSIVALWMLAILAGGLVTVAFSKYGIVESAQVMVSAMGTMGPTFIPQAELVSLHPLVKVSLMVGMLAGRLEMLPILSLLNVRLLKKIA
ncbi:MAG: TrkH family potassium uptake protein [Candidatus Nanohaloarchaea archaeon]|nr:TrkH family potassium uptake protein [Candidatus Nanohaloarchaea archaeon]